MIGFVLSLCIGRTHLSFWYISVSVFTVATPGDGFVVTPEPRGTVLTEAPTTPVQTTSFTISAVPPSPGQVRTDVTVEKWNDDRKVFESYRSLPNANLPTSVEVPAGYYQATINGVDSNGIATQTGSRGFFFNTPRSESLGPLTDLLLVPVFFPHHFISRKERKIKERQLFHFWGLFSFSIFKFCTCIPLRQQCSAAGACFQTVPLFKPNGTIKLST